MYEANKKPSLELVTCRQGRAESPWHDLAFCSTETARACLPAAVALQLPALPLGLHSSAEHEWLTVVLPAPHDPQILKELSFITGKEVIAECAERETIRRAVELAYSGEQSSEESVPQLFATILRRAIYLQSSDIHLERIDQSNVRLRYRVAGMLRKDDRITLSTSEVVQVIRRIKVLAQLDTTVTRVPQEGSFCFSDDTWNLRLRVSIVPQAHGEKAVLRLLHNFFLDQTKESTDSGETCAFESLGLSTLQRDSFLNYLHAERGVIVLSGPTGSGKSTLLYSALNYLNQESKNLVTIEDPIERIIPGICQTEIDTRNRSFASTLKALLRQDPDVVMLGEIRDRETAETALSAGLIGTLVLTTVHAGSCFEVLQRLTQLGVTHQMLASAVRLISSQRLVPKNCPLCLELHPADPFVVRLFQCNSETQLARTRGCERCKEFGTGRIGAFEFLPITEPICRLLRMGELSAETTEQLGQAARQAGYRSLAFSIRELLLNRTISSEIALQTLGIRGQ